MGTIQSSINQFLALAGAGAAYASGKSLEAVNKAAAEAKGVSKKDVTAAVKSAQEGSLYQRVGATQRIKSLAQRSMNEKAAQKIQQRKKRAAAYSVMKSAAIAPTVEEMKKGGVQSGNGQR